MSEDIIERLEGRIRAFEITQNGDSQSCQLLRDCASEIRRLRGALPSPKKVGSTPIVTRAQARVRSLKRYFTGTRCIKGHLAERFTKSGSCVVCSFDASTKWGEKQKELRKEKRRDKPRKTHHPLYTTWRGILTRCLSPKSVDYMYYGGRGITVCKEWQESFEKFAEDVGPRPDGCTLDRIDNENGYSPDNCRWANPYVQNHNKRNIRDPKILAAIADHVNGRK